MKPVLHGQRLIDLHAQSAFKIYAAKGFFGLLKRERVNRRQYQTRAEARADVFDYIERFHNPRRARRTGQRENDKLDLIKRSVKKG